MKNKQVIPNSRDTDRKKVDFMIHEHVAFDFYSDDFQMYVHAWDPKSFLHNNIVFWSMENI